MWAIKSVGVSNFEWEFIAGLHKLACGKYTTVSEDQVHTQMVGRGCSLAAHSPNQNLKNTYFKDTMI